MKKKANPRTKRNAMDAKSSKRAKVKTGVKAGAAANARTVTTPEGKETRIWGD